MNAEIKELFDTCPNIESIWYNKSTNVHYLFEPCVLVDTEEGEEKTLLEGFEKLTRESKKAK